MSTVPTTNSFIKKSPPLLPVAEAIFGNTKPIQINLKVTQNELKRIDLNSKPIQIGQKVFGKISTATASSGVDFLDIQNQFKSI